MIERAVLTTTRDLVGLGVNAPVVEKILVRTTQPAKFTAINYSRDGGHGCCRLRVVASLSNARVFNRIRNDEVEDVLLESGN